MSKSQHTFRAFRSRNYRLYFYGQSVSQIGTWMQRTAVSWVVYTMTHSAFMLGVTTFAFGFPTFLLTLYGGIVADRYNRFRILLLTQAASLVQAALLAALVLTGHYAVWEILVLSVVLGVINAFDVPARQPLVHEIIRDKDDLPNALAFNSSMNNMARLVGPALSGIVLQHFGAGVCFLLNAVSFVAVLASLLLMKLPAHVPQPVPKKALKEGFEYVMNTPAIGGVLLMLALTCLFVLPYNTLFPVFAKVIYRGNAETFGYINSFVGLGALAGAYFLATLKTGADFKKILFINTLILGLGLILFSQVTYFPLAMVFAVACGFGTMSQTSIVTTIVQMESDKNMRGRVVSFLAMAVFGMLPLGSLLIGFVSKHIGAQASLFAQGCAAILIALLLSKFLLRHKKQNIHENSPSRHGHAVGVS
ncbi:MFS transporter [Dinghuibacter silviterrae]|uniref:Putative MFS family arabinose efflux permease n=1 Tax=Dinghuibacter silviterrae TaxID=1539049 RepID=A0A4R8DVD7_9BACT|nr:MFS transporter [Dinghuibacter silviterrae]TDX01435.1 putative MFS family arabinose efflux permease [Dinghuibacter silviterrae]